MIDINTPNISEAYYWRAWNQHFLKRLPEARADITTAKRLRASGEVFTLAGIIEYDQDDYDPAQADLASARSMSDGRGNCEAAWYLGLVYMKKSDWLRSANEFVGASACYEARQGESEAFRRAMETRELDPEFKARQLANFDAAVAESRSQRYASAYNAANFYARGGNIDRAKALLEIAAQDPALADARRGIEEASGGGLKPAPPGKGGL